MQIATIPLDEKLCFKCTIRLSWCCQLYVYVQTLAGLPRGIYQQVPYGSPVEPEDGLLLSALMLFFRNEILAGGVPLLLVDLRSPNEKGLDNFFILAVISKSISRNRVVDRSMHPPLPLACLFNVQLRISPAVHTHLMLSCELDDKTALTLLMVGVSQLISLCSLSAAPASAICMSSTMRAP